MKYFLVGGAGFIGSHFVDRLLGDGKTTAVTLFDNFTSGQEWHYAHHAQDARLKVVRGDVKELPALTAAMAGHEVVIHLASNPDIARAATEPAIDFDQGTLLTHHVIEAVRVNGIARILYASGSGVYGDVGTTEVGEDFGPMVPISTYGASKLAGEALLAAYGHMYNITGCAFRFGNVVGPRQTHGVGFDFVRRLLAHPKELEILGDGLQSKSYIFVRDVIAAVLLASEKAARSFQVYNVATDYITVREIADLALECVGLPPGSVRYRFTGGDRGWKGDVPVVRLKTDRIRALGWKHTLTSREALKSSMLAMIEEVKSGQGRR
jgi:UDP-glucose 4-epimerase